jgi:hypothetical protein
MAAAWEEPAMRKLIGLCFLTATLLASSAHAQGIFIDRGDPNAVAATLGGGMVKDGFGGGVAGGWTYRGVFDAGAALDYTKFKSGANNGLQGIAFTPFLTWHAMRVEEDEMPISLSFTLGVMREFFTGNAPVANPEAWGLYVGPSVYRRFEVGASMVFVPEVLAAYNLVATRTYSGAADRANGLFVSGSDGSTGYSTSMKHSARVLLRPNMLFKAGNTRYLVMPYAGFIDGIAAGANVGAMF